ncbi:MAG: protein kinase [Planctomycetota bacterium]
MEPENDHNNTKGNLPELPKGKDVAPSKAIDPQPTDTPLEDAPTLTLSSSKPGGAVADLTPPPSGQSHDEPTKAMGTIAGGKYRILDRLGKGGMGVVYRALDVHLDREVAVKRIAGANIGDEEAVQRFMREARAIAKLTHPNIVNIFTLERDESGPFIVMEHIRGSDAATMVAERGALPVDEALRIIRGVGQALAFAHRNAVFHRDVKPSNILIDEDGTAKLVDFGLAKMGRDGNLSRTGMGMGTLTYVAPEQLDDASSVDQRSDIYSLAKTAYHLLTGDRPDAPDLEQIPAPLRTPLRKAMQSKPEKRHFAVTELVDELDSASQALSDPSVSGPTASSNGGPLNAPFGCPSCGVHNPISAKFCRSCGTGLRTTCPSCGHEELAGAAHCSNCGLNFEGSAKSVQLLESAKEKVAEGLFKPAIEDADRGIRLGHQAEPLREVRARATQLQNQLDAIVEPVRELVANNALESAVRVLADALTRAEGPLAAALKAELNAAQRAMNDATTRIAVQQAAAFEQQGRLFEAVKLLRQAHARNPDDSALGSRLAALERRYFEAIYKTVAERTAKHVAARQFEQALAGIDTARERLEGDRLLESLARLREDVAQAVVNTRLAEARRAEQAVDPETVRAHARGVLAVEPEHREAARLLKSADSLETRVREVASHARACLDRAEPSEARRLIAQHLPESVAQGPLATIRDDALRRLEHAAAHVREAQRLLEHRRPQEARAEALAALALDTKNDNAETAKLSANQMLRSRARRTRVVTLATLISLSALAGTGWLGLRAFVASEFASIDSLVEAGAHERAAERLDRLPRVLAPSRVTQMESRIEEATHAAANADLGNALTELRATPSSEAIAAAATAAANATPPEDDGSLGSLAIDALATAFQANLDPSPLIDQVDRIFPNAAPVRDESIRVAAQRTFDEAKASSDTRTRFQGLASALGLAPSPPLLDEIVDTASIELSNTLASLRDAARRESFIIEGDTTLALSDLVAAFAQAGHDDRGIDTVLKAFDRLGRAQSTREALPRQLTAAFAAEALRAAEDTWTEAVTSSKAGDWASASAQATAAHEQFMAAFESADEALKETIIQGMRSSERRDLIAAQARLDVARAAAPGHLDVAELERRITLRRTETVDLTETVSLETRFFQPRPQNSAPGVRLPPVYIGTSEVTQAQYAAIMSRPKPAKPDLPQTNVTYTEAVAFCRALTELVDEGVFRLPTSRDFTEVCEAGKSTSGYGWNANNSQVQAQPVGTRAADAIGLSDVVGNVAEWVTIPGNTDGYHLVAGGSFQKRPDDCRCDFREPFDLDARRPSIGFRVLWVPPVVSVDD